MSDLIDLSNQAPGTVVNKLSMLGKIDPHWRLAARAQTEIKDQEGHNIEVPVSLALVSTNGITIVIHFKAALAKVHLGYDRQINLRAEDVELNLQAFTFEIPPGDMMTFPNPNQDQIGTTAASLVRILFL